MLTLREAIKDAEKRKVAIGHFNISDSEGFNAIVSVARRLGLPVIVGVSEGERDFIGVRNVAALVKSAREEFNHPVFLNADHSYSFERVKEAIDAGFDSVIFDGTKLSFDENVKETRKCVEYARSVNANVIVEGELGYIGESSKILDKVPERITLTLPEEAEQFVKKTGIHAFAPAVGNIHGMLRSAEVRGLDIELISEIRKKVDVPLVLHGGSGTSDEDFLRAIEAGVSVIHINTELRLTYRNALKLSLQSEPDEIAPYKFMKSAVVEMEKLVEKRLRLFNKI